MSFERTVERSRYLNAELSLLEFQNRVLALAEDRSIPLGERLRFLAIISANLDEFYMVRVAALKARDLTKLEEHSEDGLAPLDELRIIRDDVAILTHRLGACYQDCADSLGEAGVKITRWHDLDDTDRQELRERCESDLHPELTPLAMTLSPGHPLPHLPHHSLSLAVMFQHSENDRHHLAQLEVPCSAGRFFSPSRKPWLLVPVEDVIRGNLDQVYKDAAVISAYAFRVTRGGDLNLDEALADNLLEAVAVATVNRFANPAIRLEVERAMPMFARSLLLESMKSESFGGEIRVGMDEVQEIDGLLDLRCLTEIPLPKDRSLFFPAFQARIPEVTGSSLFDAIGQSDILVHHPFDSFDETVVRFLSEAADDPDVSTLKITLYRVGFTSSVVDALLRAAHAGKRVAAFVELKARFDEDHNVAWARALEAAGANVVYGLVGLKIHAKVCLAVRREKGKLRRYVHVGTGNYNARSGSQYTDLSLFSARENLGADVTDLFNVLTGSAAPPRGLTRGALVAPHQLLPAIVNFIERERDNARNGLPARITAKMNGLSDPDVVDALYDASCAGVEIDLIVRGICTLRPGVSGLSERIRVTSVVGRFLEHSRIYRFENSGSPDYFIGSSDWRPRNLRRRVELLVPIQPGEHTQKLDHILETYMADAHAWDLGEDGSYLHRSPGSSAAQALFITG